MCAHGFFTWDTKMNRFNKMQRVGMEKKQRWRRQGTEEGTDGGVPAAVVGR